jgi:cation transport ATPase
MAKYCSQCGDKISFRDSFTINKQPVCGSCMIDRIGSGGKALPKNKIKKVEIEAKVNAKKVEEISKGNAQKRGKRLQDKQTEQKQKSLGWVVITGCLVPSVSTGILFSGYDFKGFIPLIAFAIYILLLTILSGSILWSVENIMKSRQDYSLHKMHFASNVITIIAIIVTILLILYIFQIDFMTAKSTLKEKLFFAVIMLIVAYFSYLSLFFIDRIKFAWKKKKMKKITTKKDIKAKNKTHSSFSKKTTS